MAKQNYDVLEDQIGEVGTDASSMGKLKHKNSYGSMSLTDDEQNEMDAFMARSKTAHNKKIDMEQEISISDGWVPIDREQMGTRSLFYPDSWEFMIRPATIQAIKNWTAVDEERPDALNSVFNDIMKTCVKINTHSPETANWNQINSWDRFWFILKVREYTYLSSQTNNIEFDDECSECDQEITYKLTSDGLFYEFPDEDLVEKYWNGDCWVIDPREYDVDHDPITLYTPKLGKDEAIIDWATNKYRQDVNKKIDETFIKFLVWMMPKPIKDVQLMDRQIQKIQKEYKSWDIDMFSFMNDVITNITINPSEKLKMTCPHCGQEAISTVQFPDGIKVLFEAKSSAKKFGSR